MSPGELQREIERAAEFVEERSDALTALGHPQLMERRIKTSLLPTLVPIKANHIGSSFGRRIDPIAGVGAMHEGIDFVADIGTKITSSAGGVVTVAEFHPQFGYMVEIDHGNDFSSRYAHLSKNWREKQGRSSSAGRRSPPAGIADAQPGHTCISRFCSKVWRRILCVSCKWGRKRRKCAGGTQVGAALFRCC